MDFDIAGMINVKKLYGKSITTYLWSHQIWDVLGHNANSYMAYSLFLQNRKAFSMMVIHVAFDAVVGITMLIVALGVTLGICFCVTMTTQIRGSTRLVPEVLCTFRHQLSVECDINAAFLPHQGYHLVQGLIVVVTLVTNLVFILWHFGLSRLVAIDVDTVCRLASEYHRFLRLAAWTTWLSITVVGALCAHQCKYMLFINTMKRDRIIQWILSYI